MSHRPTDWHILDLDRDPTPGDPRRVRKLAGSLHDFADDVSRVMRDIKGMANEDAVLAWAGKTADVFTAEFEDVPGKLKKLKKSYDLAGDALASYWPDLEDAQTKADKALRDGRQAREELSTATTALSGANDWVRTATAKVDSYDSDKNGGKEVPKPDEADVRRATRNAQHAQDRQASAQKNVDAAQDALDAAKRLANQAKGLREEAARRTIRKLEEASDAGIPNRRWWEEVGDWVSDHWDEIVTICKWVVLVVGLIVMLIGGPLGWLVFAAALVVLADTIRKMLNGTAGWGDLAWAALDCIPATKGITSLAKLGKLWKAGGLKALGAGAMQGIGGGLKNMADSVRDLKNVGSKIRGVKDWAKGLGRKSVKDSPTGSSRTKDSVCSNGTDPIDLATGKMYLPQTDVTLPGTLPLVFRRRVESGYRVGRWFGPSWSSTADQRLEFDTEGVIFVHEEGLLLAYPTPEPDVPVLPDHGPRWPLTRIGRPDSAEYTITDPDTGRTWSFIRADDDVAALHTIEDRNGNRVTFVYDELGAPTSIVHSSGYHLKIITAEERVTALHLVGAAEDGGDQEVIRYGYTHGHLTTVTNSSGLPLRFAYDPAGRVVSWTDTNDRGYSYKYDAENRCIFEGGPEGHMALHLTYDVIDEATGHKVTTATTSAGHTSRYLVNNAHQMVAEIDPLDNTTHYERDRYNRLLSRTDPLGNTTRFRYDEAGNLTAVIRPDGHQFTALYNDHQLPVQVTNPDGGTWRRTYDNRGNCTTTVTPSGATSRFAYDEAGRLTSVTNALGHTTTIRCDAAGLPVGVVNPLGHTTCYERDAFGRTTAVTNPLGATTRFQRTVEGNLIRRTTPDGAEESWTYDGEGNCTRHTDPLGAVTSLEHTHFDRLAARTGPDGARYEFTHDAELRLTQVTNPQGLTWNYEYDAAGRLTSETDFDGRILTYTHDAAGHLTSRTNSIGQTVGYERNALGQIICKDAEGQVTTFDYALSGRLIGATGPDATLTLEIDESGLRRSETVNGRTLTYEYDELGRRTQRTTPTGAASTWKYDAAGRRVELIASGHSIGFDRDEADRETARYIDEAITFAQAFDELGRLATQDVLSADAQVIQHRAFTYRVDGALTQIDDQLNGLRRFGLDAVGRVTAVHAQGWTETYAYDEAGNQTDASWPAAHPGHEATGPRAYTGTRITRAGGVRYEHDALGRITQRQKIRLSRKPDTWRYTWDAEDRLTSVTTPDGTRWRYRYDPLGRRTAKQRLAADGETVLEQTTFTWDGHTLCEQGTTAEAQPHPVVLTWDHDGWRPLAQTERVTAEHAPQEVIDQRFFAIVTDLVGTPTELLDENGDIAWRTRATLWGATTWNNDATAYTPLRFPGQYYDPETGLHHNYFRTYDPETARYLTPDPLGLAPAANPATYVHNPHIWIDPLGLAPGCGEDGEYLYRGVPAGHPKYDQALEGTAVPHGGHSDPGRHAGGNTDSEFTSWTHDYEDVALDAAEELGPGGIVMRVPVTDIPAGADNVIHGTDREVYEEMEHALKGTIPGAEISIDRGPWRTP